MVKSYTFKLNLDIPEEKELANAIELWRKDGHTVRSMVSTLLSKYHGLEMPLPSSELLLRREIQLIHQINKHQQEQIVQMTDHIKRQDMQFAELLDIVEAISDELNEIKGEGVNVLQ